MLVWGLCAGFTPVRDRWTSVCCLRGLKRTAAAWPEQPGTIGHGAVALAYAGRFVYAQGKVALGTHAMRGDRGADANAIGIRTEG